MTGDGPAAKPFYPWVGGKRRLLDLLEMNIPYPIGGYHEPFLGGGAVAVKMLGTNHPIPLHLNDLNAEAIHAWTAVRDRPGQLIRLLTGHHERHSREYYTAIRGQDRAGLLPALTGPERGARFLYLVKHAFGGMWKEDANGYCTSGYADRYAEVDPSNIRKLHQLMTRRTVTFTTGSFEKTLAAIKPGHLVYLDPPYATDSDAGETTFDGYNAGGQAGDLQQQVLDFANAADRAGAFVLVSNASTPTTRRLWGDWNEIGRPITYTLGVNRERENTEMLWGNAALARSAQAKAAKRAAGELLSLPK